MPDREVLRFGDFEFSPSRRALTRGGQRLRIGSRAMDILLLLLARPGELVAKEEIQARLWPDLFVDEASLRVHMSSLRKVLGEAGAEQIQTVAGRGYIFVAPVARTEELEPVAGPSAHPPLPTRIERLIGRAAVVDGVAAQILERRFVTVVGPGGIGKTSVALEVARRLAGKFADGVRFVDLATLEDPETAPGTLALALGLPVVSEMTPRALEKPLAGKQLLVVLDNCERLADAAAAVAEALLRGAPGLCVLATSREALRAEGEWVHRLPPLATPATAPRSPEEALAFSAIELFAERAQAASGGGFHLAPEDCAGVAEICRRLDGLPLAIELAAANMAALGVRGISAGLDDRLVLLTGGKRTAQSRHQTLRAALDWSFDLLSPSEQQVFNRLSVIAGRFDLDLACAVASGPDLAADVRAIINILSRKSLVATEAGESGVCYRLLESNRVYADEKLARSGARDQIARRYAEATLGFYDEAEQRRATLGAEAWIRLHAPRLDDARAALEWSFSEGGDQALGRALTAALAPIWLHMGLARECVAWCRKALSAETDIHEMKIRNAYGVAHGFTHGNNMGNRPHMVAALEIARGLSDHDYMMRSLWGLASIDLNDGNFDGVLDHAGQLRDCARGPEAAAERLVGERMIGSALHLRGRHAEAREILERVVDALADPGLRASPARFQFDQQVLARGFLAWIHWIQGDAAESRRQVAAAVAEATRVDHAGSLGFALDSAVALEMLDGDLTAAAATAQRLGAVGSNVGFETWIARGEILSAIVQVRSGDLSDGIPRLEAALTPAARKVSSYRTPFFLAELAQAQAAAGLPEKALATIDDALAWFHGADDYWCAPECFRVKAEVLRLHGGGNARQEADALLHHASDLAESHAAHAWMERVRMSKQSADDQY